MPARTTKGSQLAARHSASGTWSTSELTEVLDDRESPYRDGRLHRMLSAKGDGDHVASIGAPVFGPDGAAALSITLVTYWSTMTTPQVAAVGDAVRAAADRVTAQVAR